MQIKTVRFTLFTLLFMFSGLSYSADVAGVKIAERVQIDGLATELVLNGAGVRSKFFFKIYVGALYLEQPLDTLQAIDSDGGPKRILMHFVYDKVEKKKLDSAWWEGFEANLSPESYAQLKPEVSMFVDFFTDAVKGDEYWLDFNPDTGTIISLNGNQLGTIPGKDFYSALLKIWLGEKPVTKSLKKAMLGQK